MRIAEGINSVSEQEKYARLHEAQDVKKAEQVGKPDDTKEAGANAMPADEYIPSDPVKGIYRPGKDADGNPKIDYIDPKKDVSPGAKAGDEVSSSDPKKSESTTTDTDKVDREIEKLKEKKARLEQEIRTAEDDQKKRLEQELRQVEAELAQKDNDNYRRQNAVVS